MPAKNFTANIATDLSSASTGVDKLTDDQPSPTKSSGITDAGVVDPSPVLQNSANNQPSQITNSDTTPADTGTQVVPVASNQPVADSTAPTIQRNNQTTTLPQTESSPLTDESAVQTVVADTTSSPPADLPITEVAPPAPEDLSTTDKANTTQVAPNPTDEQKTQEPLPQEEPISTVVSEDEGTTSLVDILLEQGDIEPDRAKQVKLAEIQTGKPQEDILREQRIVTEEALIKARAKFYNIPFADLESTPVSPEALSVLPQDVAKKFNAFPINVDKAKKELHLAMSDPLDLSAIEFIEQKTGYHVKPQASVPRVIEEFIAKRYDTSLSQEVTAALKEVGAGPKINTLDASKQSGGLIRQERISEVVTHILDFSIRSRASDIHIEPLERVTRVRYRIDGILQEKLTIPRELHDSLVSRIKILSGMKIDEKRIPQDGRFNFKNQEQEVDLRVSTLPTSLGEKIVMRLLKKTGGVPDLPSLGLRGRALKNLEDAILRPHGIIVICGPTGSGKTTTLYSIIQRLNTPKVNIMTLEDPVEYKVAGVNQVQVNANVGLTFASGLRSFLRQDPNIILVGEIRDSETAGLAVQAALTGHLVFSTLHTTDAAGALPRMLDMGAEPFLLSSSITAIVAQRVMRKIDETVKEPYQPEPELEQDIRKVLGKLWPADKPITLYRGKPTPENNNSGYKGRVGIYEVIPVTDAISKEITQRAPASTIEDVAIKEGMVTMKQDGYLKALEGLTTIEEVLRVAQD